jgi:hypothetical protein
MEPTHDSSFDLGRRAARGFAAGLVATTTMSATMLALQKLGLLGRMPPRLLTERTLARFGLHRKTSRTARKALTALNHFGFGGTMGALFEIGRGTIAARRGTAGARGLLLGSGLAFGTLVWAASYAGWIPAVGLMQRPSRDRPFRPTSMVLAHGVFGGTLAAVLGTRLASPRLEVNP